MDSLKKNFQDMKSTLDRDNDAMEKKSKGVDDQLKQLDKDKNNLDPTEYQIQKQQLQAEQAQIKQIHDADEQAQKQYAYLEYLQGVLAYSKDDKKTAYNLFSAAAKGDPELEKQSSLKLKDLIASTKPEGWFERNWKAVATVGAIVAGVAVGVLVALPTFGTGDVVDAGVTGAAVAAIDGGTAAVGTSGIMASIGTIGTSALLGGGLPVVPLMMVSKVVHWVLAKLIGLGIPLMVRSSVPPAPLPLGKQVPRLERLVRRQ